MQMPETEQRLIKAAVERRFGPGGGHEQKIYNIEDVNDAIAVIPTGAKGSPQSDCDDSVASDDSATTPNNLDVADVLSLMELFWASRQPSDVLS